MVIWTCRRCGKPIEEGKHVVVWNLPRVFFICMPCSEQPEFEDITASLKEQK